MPLRSKPVCSKCEKTEALLWIQSETGILCSDCDSELKDQLKNLNLKKEDPEENIECASNSSETKSNENGNTKTLRRSTRNARHYKTRLNPFALPKAMLPKGKGRRIIFKKTPTKAPTAVATPVTSDSIFYKVIQLTIIVVSKHIVLNILFVPCFLKCIFSSIFNQNLGLNYFISYTNI